MDQRAEVRSELFFMVISALLFGYFGFGVGWAHQYTTTQPPELLVMVVVLKWTLRAGAVAFAISAVLAMMGSLFGPLLYSIAGVITAVLFVIVAVWDISSPYASGIHPLLLLVFAAWNGFGSWSGLREMMAARKRPVVEE